MSWSCSNEGSTGSLFNGDLALENPNRNLSFQLIKGINFWSFDFTIINSTWTLSSLTLLFPYDTNVTVSIDDVYESKLLQATEGWYVNGTKLRVDARYSLDLTSEDIILSSDITHTIKVESANGIFTSYLTPDCEASNGSDFSIVERYFNLTIPPAAGQRSFLMTTDSCLPLELCGSVSDDSNSDETCLLGLTIDLTSELSCLEETIILISFIILLPFCCWLGWWLICRPRPKPSTGFGPRLVTDADLDKLLEGSRETPCLPKGKSYVKPGKPVCCTELWPDERDKLRVTELLSRFRDLGISYDKEQFKCWATSKFGDPRCTIDRAEFEGLFKDKQNIEKELLISLKQAEKSMRKSAGRR